MDLQKLKTAMDRLRAEASRGPVSGGVVFAITDPIMDDIARTEKPSSHPCCGYPATGAHNASCTFSNCSD